MLVARFIHEIMNLVDNIYPHSFTVKNNFSMVSV